MSFPQNIVARIGFLFLFGVLAVFTGPRLFGQEARSVAADDLAVTLVVEQEVLSAGRALPVVVKIENQGDETVAIDPYWYLRGMGRPTRIGSTTKFFSHQPAMQVVRPDGSKVVTSRVAGPPSHNRYIGPSGAEQAFIKLAPGAVHTTEFHLWVALEDGPEVLFTQEGEYSVSVFMQSDEEVDKRQSEVTVRVEEPVSEIHRQHLKLIRSMDETCRCDLYIPGIEQSILCRDADQIAVIQRLSESQDPSPYRDYAQYWQFRNRYAEIGLRIMLLEMGHEDKAGDDLEARIDGLLQDLREFLTEPEANELTGPCRQLIERVAYSKTRVERLRAR